MIEFKEESFWILYLVIVIPKLIAIVMSVRELFPFFKWGFNIRRSNFLVPILSNNVIVTGEEAVSFEKPQKSMPLPPGFGGNNKAISPELNKSPAIKATSVSSIAVSETSSEQLSHCEKSTNCSAIVPEVSPISTPRPIPSLSNKEILEKIDRGEILPYKLEAELGDCSRAVEIRRLLLERSLSKSVQHLPYESYDFAKVQGACCENVIGYVPIPVGTAGPLLMNNQLITVPMATTEGCLVASTHRGCKAITESGGANVRILSRGMTRAPVVRFQSIVRVTEFVEWIAVESNYQTLKSIFDNTSRFARMSAIKNVVAGRCVYIRFKCDTGDAMGMNMVSKGVDAVLAHLKSIFEDMEILSISGNVCTDKKPSSINWTEGRGRSVVCEAVIKGSIVEKVLKTSVQSLVDVNIAKNLVGSAMAGSIGGFNAHASNIVTAIFLATGQDCAQNVESSNCITQMEAINDGKDLYITVTMPSIEVGTVGGGTSLPAQSQCLDIIGVKGSIDSKPGQNADQLARTVAAAVMAGELSLMSALSAGHLVKSHLQLNRKPTTTTNSPAVASN